MEIELCTNETSECVCGHTQKRHGIKGGIGIVLKKCGLFSKKFKSRRLHRILEGTGETR